MANKAKKFMQDLCKKKDKTEVWQNHIVLVAKYSKLLAKQLGADEEIAETAAWLHDIMKIEGKKEKHHVHGAEKAGKILKDMGYSDKKIKHIQACILTHSSDTHYPPKTLEAKIVASADALSHFDNLAGLAYVAYSLRKLSREEGRIWLLQKFKTAWQKLCFPEARAMVKPKYEAIKELLKKI